MQIRRRPPNPDIAVMSLRYQIADADAQPSKILEEINQYSDTVYSEQDSRVKIIDRMLYDVLEWPYANVKTEPKAGKGFIDYAMTVGKSYRFILEAKRDGKSFSFDNSIDPWWVFLIYCNQFIRDKIFENIKQYFTKSVDLCSNV